VKLTALQRKGIEEALRRCGVDVTERMVNEIADAVVNARDPDEPMLIGWTWKAHLDDLYADLRADRWLKVSQKLALMLRYALDKVDADRTATQELIHAFGTSLREDQLGTLVSMLDISQKILFMEIVKKGTAK
jgi:hypothetical protein